MDGSAGEIKDQLQELVQDLLYISESNNPWELLDWDAADANDLQQQIADFTGQPVDALKHLSPVSFFASIQMMADDENEDMMEYAARYKALQKYLSGHVKKIRVIRAGEHQVHIFLAGFTPAGEAVILHTLAVET